MVEELIKNSMVYLEQHAPTILPDYIYLVYPKEKNVLELMFRNCHCKRITDTSAQYFRHRNAMEHMLRIRRRGYHFVRRENVYVMLREEKP